jgi:hypothetical protein
MAAVAHDEAEVVPALGQCGGHLQVGAEPVCLGLVPVQIPVAAWSQVRSGFGGVARISSG